MKSIIFVAELENRVCSAGPDAFVSLTRHFPLQSPQVTSDKRMAQNSLSLALHPPLVHPSAFTAYDQPQQPAAAITQRQEEEEDDEEEVVEEELTNHTPRSPSAAQATSGGCVVL